MIDSAEESRPASSVPDNGGVYFVPALTGLGAPYWDQYARGAILGITRGTTNAHMSNARRNCLSCMI
jgi:glycerol kinase